MRPQHTYIAPAHGEEGAVDGEEEALLRHQLGRRRLRPRLEPALGGAGSARKRL